jgi:glucan-binding YG repeat protein
VKNGIVNEDGELYYYVNGVKTYAGLIQIDGNYYYVNSYCKVITNQRYWVSQRPTICCLPPSTTLMQTVR